jgi:hypothetical protein
VPKQSFWGLSPEGVVGSATAVSTSGFAAESFVAIPLGSGVSLLCVSPERSPSLPVDGEVGSDGNVGVLKTGRAAHANHSEVHAIFIQKPKKENMSVRETKKARAAKPENVAELFHEAMRSYEKALTAGIQVQEESVNLWKDLLSKLGSPEEFQTKLESMRAEAFPQARRRMEEFVETFNRMSNQTIDLIAKTLGVYQATSVTDAQRRVHDLIESSLTALRIDVHTAMNTNAKIIADWKELVDRFGPAAK